MKKTDIPTETADRFFELDAQKFNDAIGRETDPTVLVLRAHLFSENLLERLLRLKLPRGDKLVQSASFSFSQKLLIVEAMDVLNDAAISSLRALNRLRNQCAHELGKSITDADVVKVGSPLGKVFTEIHRHNTYDSVGTLRGIIDYVIGFVTGACHAIEEASTTAQGE